MTTLCASAFKELPWSADSAIQQLGRTHRSNEVCGVLYALVTSNLGGERRFSSACASRLQSLGALTKGDRRAATGSNFAQFDIDTKYGRIALRSMVDCVWKGTTALEREALAQLQAAGQNEHRAAALAGNGLGLDTLAHCAANCKWLQFSDFLFLLLAVSSAAVRFFLGQQVLPEGDEIAAHAERDEELKRDPPPADQLTTHAALIPHPQPWSVHNAPMFRECLLAMGFSEHDPPAKLQVKNFLNRILCQQHNKHSRAHWMRTPVLFVCIFRACQLITLALSLTVDSFHGPLCPCIASRSSGAQAKSSLRVLHARSATLPTHARGCASMYRTKSCHGSCDHSIVVVSFLLFCHFFFVLPFSSTSVLNFTVLSAKKEGTYSEAVTDISAEHITVRSEQTLAEMLRELKLEAAGHKGNGAKAGAHRGPAHAPTASSSSAAAAAAASSSSHANGNGAAAGSSLAADDGSRTRVYELALDRGISYEAACEMLQNVAPEQESAFTSFYLGTHPVTNAVLPLLAIKRPNSMFQFQVRCRPRWAPPAVCGVIGEKMGKALISDLWCTRMLCFSVFVLSDLSSEQRSRHDGDEQRRAAAHVPPREREGHPRGMERPLRTHAQPLHARTKVQARCALRARKKNQTYQYPWRSHTRNHSEQDWGKLAESKSLLRERRADNSFVVACTSSVLQATCCPTSPSSTPSPTATRLSSRCRSDSCAWFASRPTTGTDWSDYWCRASC